MEIRLRDIGARIEDILKRTGMTRAELGARLGVKEGAVGKYVRGVSDPGAGALAKIAEIGGVSIDYLVTGKGAAAPAQISEEDALALVVASRPEAFGKMREKLKAEIREEQEAYAADRRHFPLSDRERDLVENYRHASEEIRDATFDMLKRSAIRSREKDGAGSDSKAGNCA